MIYIITEPAVREDSFFQHKITHLKLLCQKKRIPVKQIQEFAEVNIHCEDDSLVLFGISTNWVLQIIKENRKTGINIIVAEDTCLPSHYSIYSSVVYDWATSISTVVTYLNQYNKHNTALFGFNNSLETHLLVARMIEKNFPAMGGEEQFFPLKTTLEECFNRLISRINAFDSVICSNDLTAVFLLNRIKKNRPELVKKLFVISLEGATLSRFYSIGITSFSNQFENFTKKIIELYLLHQRNGHTGLHLSISGQFQIGDSTQRKPFKPSSHFFAANFDIKSADIKTVKNPVIRITPDKNLQNLERLERLLQNCTAYEIKLLISILEKDNYEDIALFFGENFDTTKYYTRKLFRIAGLKSKEELKSLITEYLTAEDLQKCL